MVMVKWLPPPAALLLGMLLLLVVAGCESADEKTPAVEEAEKVRTIVAVGDSLTAGFGVAEEESYPALLGERLRGEGYPYRVVNAGVSAETSSGTLSRLDWLLTLDPDIVILETGANDGLRGIDPELLEENLRAILRRLAERQVVVVLAGMKMVVNLGPAYVSRFNAIYPRLADEFALIFYPFFLDGVAMQPAYNLADGVHPNPAGYRKIVDGLYPFVLEAIERDGGR